MPPAIQNVETRWVTLSVDGSSMEVYVARPQGNGPWPGVLVFMEIFGVNRHIRSVTERIAAEGYVAAAINYYHRTTPNLELGYTEADVAEGRAHKDRTTREGLLRDVRAAIAYLNEREDVQPKNRFGCIGFCFGGHVAYIAATLPEMAATASFYGGGIATFSPGGGAPTVESTPAIHGKILCLFGTQDPLIPHEETMRIEEALKAAGKDFEVLRYEAGHGFFCDQRGDYQPEAADDAWNRVRDLFNALRS